MSGESKSAVLWYGPVALAGVLLFLALNGVAIWDRLTAQEDVTVEGVGKVVMTVAPDTAVFNINAKTLLAGTAKEAAAGLGAKVEAFVGFVKGLQGVSVAVAPVVIDQSVIQVGDKYARSYTGGQSLDITVTDMAQVAVVIDKAVEMEVGDIGTTRFVLKNDVATRAKVRAQAAEKARLLAAEHAKALGRTLGKLIEEYENSDAPTSEDAEVLSESEAEHLAQGEDSPSSGAKTISLYQSVTAKYDTK